MSIVSPFSRSARARQNFNTSKSASASATTNKASRPKARPLPPSSLRGARTERRRNTDVSPETKRRPLLNNTLKGKVKLSPMSVSVNFSYRPMTAPKLPNDLILNDHNSHNSYGDNRHLKSKHRNIHRKQSQTQKSHYSNGQGYNVGQGYYTRYDGNDEAERHNHDIALDRQKSDNTFVHVVQANRLPYSIFSDEKGNTEQYASANKIAAKQAHIIHSASTSLSRHSHAHPRHHPDHTRPNLCTAPSSGDDFHPSPNTMHNRHSKSFSEMKNSNHAPPHNDSIDDGNDIGKTEQADNCHTKSKAHHSSRSHTRDEGALPPMSTDNMNSEESENLANVMELQRALLRKRQQHDRLVIAHKALHERFTAQQTESEENQSSVLLLHTQIDDLRGKLRASIEEHQKCKPMMNAAEKAMGAKQHLNQRIEHLTRQLQQAREENTEFTATKAELAMWKKRYIKSEEKYHPLYALYQELTQEHAPCLSTISHLTDSVEQFQKNIKQISEDRSMLYGEAEKATQKTRELQARISELAPYQPKYELCEKQRKKLDEELEKVRRAHFIVSGDMVRLKSEHKQVQQAAYEVRVQFKALQDTHSYCRDFKPQLDEVSAEREKLIIEKHELMVRLDEALLAHSGCSVIEEELAQTISARDDIEVQYKGTKAALQEVTTSEHKLKATVLALKKDIVDIEEPFARLRKDNKGALEKIIKLQDERV